jgi:hypothetical protein
MYYNTQDSFHDKNYVTYSISGANMENPGLEFDLLNQKFSYFGQDILLH